MEDDNAILDGRTVPRLPSPPSPSADSAIVPAPESTTTSNRPLPSKDSIDIFKLDSSAALKLLCTTFDVLILLTDQKDYQSNNMSILPSSHTNIVSAEKENDTSSIDAVQRQRRKSRQWMGNDNDVPRKASTPLGSPDLNPGTEWTSLQPREQQPTRTSAHVSVAQQSAIVRKFFSKKPPAISLEHYLARLQRYCPMSPGVYLATSLYVYQLSMIEKVLPITPRNSHRLVLAGVRIAMKALEDLSYPHSRFAKVGGVTEAELARLEISFCFISDFNLRVTQESLLQHVQTIVGYISRLEAASAQRSRPRGLSVLKDKRDSMVNRSLPSLIKDTRASVAAG